MSHDWVQTDQYHIRGLTFRAESSGVRVQGRVPRQGSFGFGLGLHHGADNSPCTRVRELRQQQAVWPSITTCSKP